MLRESRIVAAGLAAVLGANAVCQLVTPFWWFGVVPGVSGTGGYNPHFIRDIGAAYLVTAAGLAWFAWRPGQGWPALALAAGFLGLHAGVHVFDASCGADPFGDLARDLPAVFLPALLAAGVATIHRPRRPEAAR